MGITENRLSDHHHSLSTILTLTVNWTTGQGGGVGLYVSKYLLYQVYIEFCISYQKCRATVCRNINDNRKEHVYRPSSGNINLFWDDLKFLLDSINVNACSGDIKLKSLRPSTNIKLSVRKSVPVRTMKFSALKTTISWKTLNRINAKNHS